MRQIKRSAKHEDMVRMLMEQPHPDTKKPIFSTHRALMRFAATLGYDQEKRLQLESECKEVDGRRFESHDQTLDLMLLLALAETRSSEVFLKNDEEQMVVIFEEYAEGGFEIMEGWMKARPDDLYGDNAIFNGLADMGYIDEKSAKPLDDVKDGIEF